MDCLPFFGNSCIVHPVWGLSQSDLCVCGVPKIMQNHSKILPGGVLGQPVSGLLAGWLGPLETLFLYGAALLVFVVVVSSTTRVTRLD